MNSAKAVKLTCGGEYSRKQNQRQNNTEEEWENNSGLTDHEGGVGLFPQMSEVHFHADYEHKENDAHLTEDSQRAEGRRRENKTEKCRAPHSQ